MARTPGIEIAGNMLRGVGIPDCIVSGEMAASNLVSDLRNPLPANANVSYAAPT
jgi:hypothetical protein